MASAYERKKEPALVRRRLLEHGARLCVEHGVAGLSLQAVADTAGVTKGGLLHHFPTKQALVDAIFDELLQSFEGRVRQLMDADPERFGRFTRAYINATLELLGGEEVVQWSALMMSSVTEPRLKQRWADWLDGQLKQNKQTDSAPALELARYAADGIWLAALLGQGAPPSKALRQALLGLTRKS